MIKLFRSQQSIYNQRFLLDFFTKKIDTPVENSEGLIKQLIRLVLM